MLATLLAFAMLIYIAVRRPQAAPAPRVEEARISDRPGVAVRVGQGAVENEGQLAQRQHG